MLERLGGDDGLARQLAALFREECPKLMTAIRDGVEQRQADGLRRAAHCFKGSVGNFTDGAPTTTAFELEMIGKDERLDAAPEVFARFEREVDSFLVQLHRFEQGA